MKITRFHNKKELAFNFKTITLSIVSFLLLALGLLNADSLNFIDIEKYKMYFIGLTILFNIFLFSNPFLLYKDTFKSELVLNQNKFLFKDIADMYNVSFDKQDIKEVVKGDTTFYVHLKNQKKPFVFLTEKKDADKVFDLLTSF